MFVFLVLMLKLMYVEENRRLFHLLIVRLKQKEYSSNSYHYYCPYSYSYEYHHLDDGCEYSDGNFGIEFIRQRSSNRTRLYYCSQCEMMNLNGDTRIDAHVSGNHVPEVDGHRLVRVVSLHSLIGKTDDDAIMYEHRHKTQVRILLKVLLFICLFVLSVGQLIV